MRKSLVSFLVAIAAASSFSMFTSLVKPAVASASGIAYTWTGDGDQHSWGDAQNWNPQGVPGAADSADIGTASNPGPQVYVPPGTTVSGLTVAEEAYLYSGPTTQDSQSNITVTGTFDWTGDTASNGIYIAVDALGSVVVSGTGLRILDSYQGGELTIEHGATLSITNSQIALYGQAVIDVKGTFDAGPAAVVSAASCCVAPATVVDESTGVISVAKSGATPGSLTLDAAELDDMGTIEVGKDCTLSLEAPSSFADGVTLDGAGTTSLTSQVTLGNSLVLGKGNHIDVGVDAVVEGTAVISGSANLGWSGGEIDGAVTVGPKIATTISGESEKELAGIGGTGPGGLTLEGKTSLLGPGRLIMGGESVLTNTGSMTLEKAAYVEGGVNDIVNSGTVTVAAGKGAVTVAGPQIENSGTVSLKSGTFEVGPFSQSSGSTELGGGKLVASQPVAINGGTFTGHGPVSGGLDNGGTVAPDDTGGVLSDNGSYTQSAAGTLALTIDGAGAGSGYSQLAVSASATVTGSLYITTASGFVPSVGETFTVLTSGSGVSGSFSNVMGTQLSNGHEYEIDYGADSVTLTVV